MFIKKTILLLFITIALSCCTTTKDHWQAAQDKNTIAAYKAFVLKYPTGSYSDLARSKIDLLSYTIASKDDTIGAYQHYITQFPHGKKLAAAQSRIEDLEFDDVQAANSKDRYVAFLKNYPSGKHSQAVEAKIEQIEWDEAQKMHTVAAYTKFRNKYPNSPHLAAIDGLIDKIEFKRACKKDFYQDCKAWYKRARYAKHTVDDRLLDQAEQMLLGAIEAYYEKKKYSYKGLSEASSMLTFVRNKKAAAALSLKFFMNVYDFQQTKGYSASNFIDGFVHSMTNKTFNTILAFPSKRDWDIIHVIDKSGNRRGIPKLLAILKRHNQKRNNKLCIIAANVLGKLKAGPEAAIPALQCLNTQNSTARYAGYSVGKISHIQGFVAKLIKYYQKADLSQKAQTLMTILELDLVDDNAIKTAILKNGPTCDNKKCFRDIIRQGRKNTELVLIKHLIKNRYDFMAEDLLNSHNKLLATIGYRFCKLYALQTLQEPGKGAVTWGGQK